LMINGILILFDMGPGTLRQLTKAGLRHDRISKIFLTHFHPDHTADLIQLLFATKNPSILKKRPPFTITGASGLNSFINHLQDAYYQWLTLPPEIMAIEELDPKKMPQRDYNTFKITALPTKHTSSSLAYRVQDPAGKTLVYSGDTDFCEEVIELALGTDLLILECSFPDGQGVEGHLTPSQCGRIARLAKAHRLLLIHFYPECLNTDITAQCRKTFGGELILGRDLLHVHI